MSKKSQKINTGAPVRLEKIFLPHSFFNKAYLGHSKLRSSGGSLGGIVARLSLNGSCTLGGFGGETARDPGLSDMA